MDGTRHDARLRGRRRTGPPPPRSSLTATAVALLAVIPAFASGGHPLPDRGGGPETARTVLPDQPLSPEMTAVDLAEQDRDAAGLHALDQLLPRDRAADRLLEQAARDIADGNAAEAIADLQTLFDRPHDLFSRPTEFSAPRSLRDEAEDLLFKDPAALAAYRDRFDPIAAALLKAALSTDGGQEAAGRELLRRYPASSAAAALLTQRMRTAWDAGRMTAARQFRDRLLRHAASLEADQMAVAVAVGSPDSPRTLDRTASTGRVQLTSATVAQAADPSPLLTPLWSASHAADVPDAVRAAVDHWRTGDSANGIGARSALLRGTTLVVRGFMGIRARDVKTGRVLWSVETPDALTELPGSESSRGRLDRAVLYDTARGDIEADSERVYFVEGDATTRGGSQLHAVRITDGSTAWRTSAAGQTLGPGQVVSGGLLVLREKGQSVRLSLLDARTGEVKWSQPIAVAGVAAESDGPRTLISTRPVVAGETVLCATQLGVLVAVDRSSGSLRWAYRDAQLTAGRGGRPRTTSSRHPHPPRLPGRPIVSGDIVFTMSPQSADVAAVSLHDGRPLWRLPRESAVAIAGPCQTPRGRSLLLIGRRFVRAVDVIDGAEQFRLRTPPLHGKPTLIGSTLWLPTESGRTAAVDVRTRRVVDGTWQRLASGGTRVAESGNLLATPDWLVSCGPTELTVYPMAAAARREAIGLLRTNPLDANAKLTLARVNLSQGHPSAALDALRGLRGDALPTPLRPSYEHILRESLFGSVAARYGEVPETAAESFDRLQRLARTAEQSARVLLCRGEAELAGGRPEAAVRAAHDVIRICATRSRVDVRIDRHRVRADLLAARLIDRAIREGGLIVSESRTLAPLLAASTERDGRESFLRAVESAGEADAVRLALADDLAAAGETQAAELNILQVLRRDAGPPSEDDLRHAAAGQLAQLYASCGRPREAALIRDSVTGFEPVSDVDAAEDRRLREVRGPVYDASITVRETEPPTWASLYDDTRPKIGAPGGAGFDLLDLGTIKDQTSRARLATLERTETDDVVRQFEVPAHYWHPTSRSHAVCGHLMPLGASHAEAVSLLESRVLWTAGDGERSTRGKVGLVTPAVTIVQHAGRLLGLDSLTGKTLWERTDIDPRSGLWYDESGLFGDAELLTLIEEDGNGYSVFETATGRRIRGGTLVPPGVGVLRGSRVSGGRRLSFVSANPKAPRGRRYAWKLLDPRDGAIRTLAESGRFTLDTLPSRHLSEARRVAALDADGRLILLRVDRGEVEVDVADVIDPDDLTGLNVVRRGELLVVDVCRVAASARSVPPTSILKAASRAVGGELTVLRPDGRGGAERLWYADLGRGAILDASQAGPVLVHLSRLRSLKAGQDRTALTVVRLRDGRTLAQTETLPKTVWLRLSESPDHRTMELTGMTHAATISLGGSTPAVAKVRGQ